jgi:lipopolysaccharide export system protein LptA
MRLERVFTHRLVRVLRVAVPLLVAALIAIPVWNYVTRGAKRSVPEESIPLPSDLALRTEGFTFSRTEGGRTLFTIRAKNNLGFKDNRNMLEDVEVTVYGASEAEPTRTIRSKHCSYDQETQDIRFEGGVEAKLDERTTLRSEELTYNHRDRLVASMQPTFVEQPGFMKGRANGLEYGLDSGLLKLTGAVKVDTTEQTSIETESALFQQKENWTTMAGGVLLKSRTGWIRGKTGRADLMPGTYKPKTITIEGDVDAESRGQSAGDLWKLRGRWLEAAMSASDNVEHVKARGNVEVEKISESGRQVLSAEEIDASVNANGTVDLLHARRNAKMTLGSDRTLRSTEIWANAAQSVETAENSVLEIGSATIEGRQFTIQQGEAIRFTTQHRATLRSGPRVSSAEQTRATFDSRTNTLSELVQTGNFEFKDEKYSGRAQNARFEENGGVVTLEGSPVVTDAEKRLEAAEIRLNQKDNSFVATRNVRTFMRQGADPFFVKSARAEGGADSMIFTGSVELWRDPTYIKADVVRAASLGKTNKLYAEGTGKSQVQTNFNGIRATSNTLDYDDSRNIAHYTGNVRAQKQDMILEASDLIVTLRAQEKSVSEITASGGVVVTRGNQRGTGAHAVYDAASELVTLTGSPAQIQDKVRGTTTGPRMVMKTTGESGTVEGGKGGRTVTKHPVRP